MPWLKVDDKFHAHHKPRLAGKAAVGVWVLAGSWCMDNPKYDGFVPANILRLWGSPGDARKLVDAGLWHPDELDGQAGWRFNDWHEYNPDYETIQASQNAASASKSVGGRLGNHNRWHKAKGVTVESCEFCFPLTDPPEDIAYRSDSDRIPIASASDEHRPVPEPVPDTPTSNEVGEITPAVRDDVERICTYLADAITENGSKRPTVTKAWRDAARLMLDKDGRTEHEVLRAIDWCQRGDTKSARFWRPNVMSMPKLRDKFDPMRLQAIEEQRAPQPASALKSPTGWLAAAHELHQEEA